MRKSVKYVLCCVVLCCIVLYCIVLDVNICVRRQRNLKSGGPYEASRELFNLILELSIWGGIKTPGQGCKNSRADIKPPGQGCKNSGADIKIPGQGCKNSGADIKIYIFIYLFYFFIFFFWSILAALSKGFSPAILNAEKALGTRLQTIVFSYAS